MPVVVVVGGQWGDEGKGKIVDILAERAELVVRYQGGNNAGHTVVNDLGKFALNLVPAGIFYPGVTCVLGNGVVVDPAALLGELDALRGRGIDVARFRVSDRAHVVMPYHVLTDGLEEAARGGRALGTTKKGIGPAYADKVNRIGIRVGDLLDPALFRDKLDNALSLKNKLLTCVYDAEPLDLESMFGEYRGYGERLRPHVVDSYALVQDAIRRQGNVVLEGAQGSLLDLDFGTYPFVTSSSTLCGGSTVGAGISPRQITHAVGVFKAYSTRVGGGPFPTELADEVGERLREVGGEYGVVTRRPRRCGWFDGVAARFSADLNGFDSAVITKLDVLDGLETVKICTGYRVNGDVHDRVPTNLTELERCGPVFEELPGWAGPTRGVASFEALPTEAQRYLECLEATLGCPIAMISFGPARSETIIRRQILS